VVENAEDLEIPFEPEKEMKDTAQSHRYEDTETVNREAHKMHPLPLYRRKDDQQDQPGER